MSTPDPASIALARQMPWTVAEQESIWLASGRIDAKSTFSDCLLYALPHYITGGEVVFVFVPDLSRNPDYIRPHMIARATEMVLTFGNAPLTAYYERDQPLIDRALEETR